MSSQLIGLLIAALGTIVTVGVAVGFPALAIIAVRYFKLKERELTLEMEYRQKSAEQNLALEDRVQRLEDVLTTLDRDVRERLGMQQPTSPLPSRPDLVESPAAEDPQREESREPSWTKVR
jgi:hypothetical protein